MPTYVAILRKAPDSDYGVEFPDVPGCISAGADLDEARQMGAEALAFHLEGLREDGDPVPAPSSRAEIEAQGIPSDLIEVQRRAHLRYKGTDTALIVAFGDRGKMTEEFEALHRQGYGFTAPGRGHMIEAISVEQLSPSMMNIG